MRSIQLVVILAALILAATPAAAAPERSIRAQTYKHIGQKHCERYDALHDWATKQFGKKVVGRDVCRYGMPKRGAGDRVPTKAEFATTMGVLRRWKHPPQVEHVATASSATASGTVTYSGGGGVPAELEAIAQCESGGNYGAVNPSSGAYGKYQILPSTSAAYGCDMATPAGQDACAVEIYAGGAGRSQWVC